MSNEQLRAEQIKRALREAVALSEHAQRTSENLLAVKSAKAAKP
jgi:hypothetical protein